MSSAAPPNPQRILVVMPTWLGDVVMATPTLRALRSRFPDAHITALLGASLLPILDACPWMDAVISPPKSSSSQWLKSTRQPLATARTLREHRFDLAVLLPNSFKSALTVALAGIPRRIGYARDGRSWLLTDQLTPARRGRKYLPVPTLRYYLAIAEKLGAPAADRQLALFTTPDDDRRAADLLQAVGVDPLGQGLAIIAPGAKFGDAKMWPPERFAAVADLLQQRHNLAVAVSGAPGERAILDHVIASAKAPIIDLPARSVDLKLLKSIVKLSKVVICNDSGLRHVAAALGKPVVTIFGPTDPAWTVLDQVVERQIQVPVDCGPCQLKRCPLDHRCMTRITPERVSQACGQLVHLQM